MQRIKAKGPHHYARGKAIRILFCLLILLFCTASSLADSEPQATSSTSAREADATVLLRQVAELPLVQTTALPDSKGPERVLTYILIIIIFLLLMSGCLLWFVSRNARSATRESKDRTGKLGRADDLPVEESNYIQSQSVNDGRARIVQEAETISPYITTPLPNQNRDSPKKDSSASAKLLSMNGLADQEAKLEKPNDGEPSDALPPSTIERSEFETTVRGLTQRLDTILAEVHARNGNRESKVLGEIRLFCTTHRFGFRLSRGNRQVTCPLGGHLLGSELPYEGDWFYCCDCQRFWPITLVAEFSWKSCPCCDRQIVRRYLCDRCRVVSVISNVLTGNKEFTITEQGISPYCPGCLMQSPRKVWAHQCARIEAELITAQQGCSLCTQTSPQL